MRRIRLTDGQSVRLYGLLPTCFMLDWDTVVRMRLRHRWLRETLRLTAAQLRDLQGDAAAWAGAGLVDAGDCAAMREWPLNPLVHLQTPVDELRSHAAADLRQYGVSFAQMQQAGLTNDTMLLFHFSLAEWQALGFSQADARTLTDTQARLLFGMSARDVAQQCGSGENGSHDAVRI
jgi:hypothetical protein